MSQGPTPQTIETHLSLWVGRAKALARAEGPPPEHPLGLLVKGVEVV
jgi:hypothetical protein